MSSLEVHESILLTDSDAVPLAVPRARPAAGGPYPLVVLFQDRYGIRDAMRAYARRLAGHGYDVIIPDLYHRHGALIGYGPSEVADDPGSQDRLSGYMAALTDDGIQRDLDAALDAVTSDRGAAAMGQAACIGFCLGARAVFRTMMRLPEQFVAGSMWHPSFLVDGAADSPHLSAGELSGSLYVGFGEADQMMTVASMEPFIEAVSALGERVVIDIHPGADHGYTWPGSPNYSQTGAKRAWTQTLNLFEAALGPTRG